MFGENGIIPNNSHHHKTWYVTESKTKMMPCQTKTVKTGWCAENKAGNTRLKRRHDEIIKERRSKVCRNWI